jgi:CubicO group peptidase (beta-lactamase class C family)
MARLMVEMDHGQVSADNLKLRRGFWCWMFAGTSLWIDPDRNLFVALLTNAVHPTAVIDQSP